jgi:hypothetical protein
MDAIGFYFFTIMLPHQMAMFEEPFSQSYTLRLYCPDSNPNKPSARRVKKTVPFLFTVRALLSPTADTFLENADMNH